MRQRRSWSRSSNDPAQPVYTRTGRSGTWLTRSWNSRLWASPSSPSAVAPGNKPRQVGVLRCDLLTTPKGIQMFPPAAFPTRWLYSIAAVVAVAPVGLLAGGFGGAPREGAGGQASVHKGPP